MTGSRSFGRDLDAAREALRVEHLEQRREAVGVAVVRRGGQEQAVLEALGQLADRPGELARDRIARAAGRRRMMRLVEDEQRARAEIAEHVAQPRDVVLVGQQAVRDDEARAGGPWIDGKAAQAPQLADALAIDDVEGEAELALKLVLPLHRHGGRRGDDDEIDAPAQQQLARDEAGLDRLAEADVVGDQEVDARKPQRLAQRQELVGVKPDAGTERRLQQVAVGGGRRAPADRAHIRGENLGTIGRAAADARPSIFVEDARRRSRHPTGLRSARLARRRQCRRA